MIQAHDVSNLCKTVEKMIMSKKCHFPRLGKHEAENNHLSEQVDARNLSNVEDEKWHSLQEVILHLGTT